MRLEYRAFTAHKIVLFKTGLQHLCSHPNLNLCPQLTVTSAEDSTILFEA